MVAIIFSTCCPHNIFSLTLIAANLLIAVTSLSDLDALFTGLADCFYCGNFGFIARRKPDDGERLLPAKMLDIAQQMGQETEMRGEQAGGGLAMGRDGDRKVLVGEKIVNRKRGNLTRSLEAAFAPIRRDAISAGIRPLESSTMGVWHYRYATSGTTPSKLETHWHQWMDARDEKVWQYIDREWICQTKNVNHRITHNGDFDAWHLFGKDIDNQTLGLWLGEVLHTPNAAKGDSPKIAGMMDLLVTQGMWYPSVRLAYQQAISAQSESKYNVDVLNTASGDKPNGQGFQPRASLDATCPNRGCATQRDLNTWVEIFERTFTTELCSLKYSDPSATAPADLKSSTHLQQNILQAFNRHSSTTEWSQLQIAAFIQFVLEAFFENDLYRATQIFMAKAKGTFGLVTVSTLSDSKLVLSARGQPITIGFDWSQGYMVYASEPAAVDRILIGKPQSFRLDLDAKYGEIARVGASDISVYSLSEGQELTTLKLKARWISMAEHPYIPYIQPNKTSTRDPVADDIKSIPRILHQIKTIWQDPTSLNCQSADYLVQLLIEKVYRFEKRQRLMFHAGLISQVRKLSTIDLLITGEENSLWLGEKFAQDLKVVFPFLNVVTISANQVLRQLEQFDELYLDKDSLILAITQSGQTFSTVQAIAAFDHLSSQGVIGELFSLSYGIASLEVHGSNPQNHLLHAFGHRVVRGTLFWLGVPDGRSSQQQRAAENAAIMTGKQANGIKNFNTGAEIIALGRNPAIAHKGFSGALVLSSNDNSIYARNLPDAEQQKQIEELKESCFGAFERLLASYVFFWALAKKVADFPVLKYEYWKSQSRTKVMTTASPMTGLDASKFNERLYSFLSSLSSSSK